jgi:3-oxoacyl-[acyl-carrier-protein] synthase II
MLARMLEGGCDLVHAHATGTAVSDPVELSAIVAAGHRGYVYSHKAALGHSLGAAGMVAAVINCISHRKSIIPGNVRTTYPLAAGELVISRTPTFARVERSVVLAAGFGGPLGAVRLVYS